MPIFYRDESGNPKWNAQRNLQGRTHYVDDDTLRYHKSRVIHTRVLCNGLLFALIESCATTYDGSKRGFRPVVFDIFGNVIERNKLEDCFSRSKAANNALWQWLETIPVDFAEKHTKAQASRNAENYAREMADLCAKVDALQGRTS